MADLYRRRYTVPPEVGTYRYQLVDEDLALDGGIALWIMLNPSKANAVRPDPTATRVVAFTPLLGRQIGARLRGWAIGNLAAWVTKEPSELPHVADPIGPENDRNLVDLVGNCGPVVVAWGSLASHPKKLRGVLAARAARVLCLLRDAGARDRTYCLGTTADGNPRHPLYVSHAQRFEEFTGAEALR